MLMYEELLVIVTVSVEDLNIKINIVHLHISLINGRWEV